MKKIFFLFFLVLSLNIKSQELHMSIGSYAIPFKIDEWITVWRAVSDSMIIDKAHKYSNCFLGKYNESIDIHPQEIQHFRREFFIDKGYTWTRISNDVNMGNLHYDLTFLADSTCYYPCTMLQVDSEILLDPVTLEEATMVHTNNGFLEVKYYLGEISRQDLITSIYNSFGFPTQTNIRLRSMDTYYLIDSVHYNTINVDFTSPDSVKNYADLVKALPTGSLILIKRISPLATNGRNFHDNGYLNALLKIKD